MATRAIYMGLGVQESVFRVLERSSTASSLEIWGVNVGAFIIRIGFGGSLGVPYYNIPPNPILIAKAPTSGSGVAMGVSENRGP